MCDEKLVKKLATIKDEHDLEESVREFSPSNVIAYVELWSADDCDLIHRRRLDTIRHFRTRLLAERVSKERTEKQQAQKEHDSKLRLDCTPLLDGSVNDPQSEAAAALSAGFALHPPTALSTIFGSCTFYLFWSNLKWKEIPRCYGRFTLRRCERHLSELTPMAFAIKILKMSSNALGAGERQSDNENDQQIQQSQFGHMERHELAKKDDAIILVPFLDGGGLLTYQKISNNRASDTDEIRYVHTLNSSSGWSRKLYALGIKR